MKPELKHLAPYLPYGLKAIDTTTKEVREVVLSHFTCDLETVGLNHLIEEGILIREHKPLLIPLTELTDYMAKRCSYKDANALRLMIISQNIPYIGMKSLFNEHYDVFGLIKKGMAIDINTLKS